MTHQYGLVSSMQQIQQQLSQQQMYLTRHQHKDQSNMCVECGCEAFGSQSGMSTIPGGMLNVSTDGEAGLTLNMTATPEQRERFINEQ
jgi:hypothetical protein